MNHPHLPTTAQALAADLIARTEKTTASICHLAADTGIPFTATDIVEAVERALPPGYPHPTWGTGTRYDAITDLAQDILTDQAQGA